MKSFPMFFTTTRRVIVVLGAGPQAVQKCRLLLKTDAQIHVLGTDPDPELKAWAQAGRVAYQEGAIRTEDLRQATLGFIATGCPAADHCLHDLAKQAGLLVNVVDRPALCDVMTPSIVDRDPVVVAIGTEGTAPVLARQIKTDLEHRLDPALGRFAAIAGQLRGDVARFVPQNARRGFWKGVFSGAVWQRFRQGDEAGAITELKRRMKRPDPMPETALITVIDTSAGAADLLSLRAVARLQEADVIFHTGHKDQAVLELARRDAEREILSPLSSAQQAAETMQRACSPGARLVWLRDFKRDGKALSTEVCNTLRGATHEVLPGVAVTTDRETGFARAS